MEFLSVQNVTFPFGFEVTRLTLFRIFSAFGDVGDIVLNKVRREASISFLDSSHAQEAILRANGLLLFGEQILVQIAPPPLSDVHGLILSLRPANTLLIVDAPYLWVTVNLKYVCGVTAITPVRLNVCMVSTASDEFAKAIRKALIARRNRWRKRVSVYFLRRLN